MNSTLGSVVPLAMFSLIDHQSSLLLFHFKLYHWISIVFLVSIFVFLSDLYGEALRATDDLLRGKERTFGGGAGGTAGLPKYFCLTQLFSLSLSKTMFYHFCICHISETLTSQLFGQRSSGRFLGLRGSHGTPLLVHGLVGISPCARKLWVTYLQAFMPF